VGNWGSNYFGGSRSQDQVFQDVVDKFPSGLKQAIFAATSRTTIKRRTWDGCALNAAGFEVGKQGSVDNMAAASATFGVSQGLVATFIDHWDHLPGTDEVCTQKLRTMIETAGLFSGPRTKRRTRTVQSRVYKEQQRVLREQFDVLVENNMIPDEELALEILTA
jgi:hypothetical protein